MFVLSGMEQAGIDELIFNSIMKCHVDVRHTLFGNICLSGLFSIVFISNCREKETELKFIYRW